MKIHYRVKSGELYLLNVESNTTMQEVTTKIQEQGGLQLPQVSLSMVKNSCKYIGEYLYRGRVWTQK